MEQQPTGLSQGLTFLIAATCFVVIVAGMKTAADLLVPFLLSVFIAIIFAPPLFWLRRKGVPGIMAIIFIIACIVGIGYGIAQLLGSSVADFTNSIPIYRKTLIAQSAGFQKWLARMGIVIDSETLSNYLNPSTAMQMAAKTLTGLSGALTNAFLILLTVIFILLEAAGFPNKIRIALKSPEKSLAGFSRFMESVNRYMALKTIFSLLTGLIIFVWLTILGLDFAILWGLLAFLLNYIPNIGSILAAIPAVLLALVQLGPLNALLAAAGYLVVNIIIGTILEPRFMGGGLGLSTLVVFLSLVFWGWVLGPVGMLLSVPLTMIIKIALESHEESRWISVMLGVNPTRAGISTNLHQD